MPKQRQPQKKMNPERYAKLIGLLLNGEYNCKDLAKLTGIHYVTVLEYTRALHDTKPNILYIHRWERDMLGRDAIKVYKFGPGMEDAKRRVLGRSEQQRRYRRRKAMKGVVTLEIVADSAAAPLSQPSWPFVSGRPTPTVPTVPPPQFPTRRARRRHDDNPF